MSTKTTYLIITVNVMIYLMMYKVGGVGDGAAFSNATLLRFGADFAPLVRDGQWWRMVTSTFIHITPIHIAMNMIALYQVGVVLEPHYGRMRYVLLYLASGLGGSVASLAWNWTDPVVSAGASGAISGLIAAGAVSGHMLVGLSKGAKQYRDSMVRWLIMIVGYGVFAHVDGAAHGGGMVVGAGISWLLDRRGGAIRRAQDEGQRDHGLGLETLLLFAVVAGSFFLASRAPQKQLAPMGDDDQQADLMKNKGPLLEVARRAVKERPNDAEAHDNLANILCMVEEYRECADEARLTAKLAPDDSGPLYVLSMAERKLGHDKEADAADAEAQRRDRKAADK